MVKANHARALSNSAQIGNGRMILAIAVPWWFGDRFAR